MKLFILGPGGAGKTTTGKLLAEDLKYDFLDLDQEFMERVNNIGDHIQEFGYDDYFKKNSELFFTLLEEMSADSILVLSSGFMMEDEVKGYSVKHLEAMQDHGTIIRLLPSRDIDVCIDIIVGRQLQRGFGLRKDREVEKVLSRVPVYEELGDIKIYSSASPEDIVKEIIDELD